MRRSILAFALGAAVTMVATRASATDIGKLLNNPRPQESFGLIHVSDLVRVMHDKDAHVHIYDANHNELREKAGMIPGARPLSSYDNYDVADELPTSKDAKIVFYCADLH